MRCVSHRIVDGKKDDQIFGNYFWILYPVHSIFFVFWSKWPKPKKLAVLFFLFFVQKIRILPGNDTWFFVFGHWPKNEKQKMEWTRHFGAFTWSDCRVFNSCDHKRFILELFVCVIDHMKIIFVAFYFR